MALENRQLERPVWENPVWPDPLPDAEAMRILYGSFADELVIRFDDRRYSDATVALIDTPKDDYAGLVVELNAGAVIGIHVYPLVALAGEHHPSWRRAAEPNPPAEVATKIVSDIKLLYDRYGLL
jgi:hypothetical protein